MVLELRRILLCEGWTKSKTGKIGSNERPGLELKNFGLETSLVGAERKVGDEGVPWIIDTGAAATVVGKV